MKLRTKFKKILPHPKPNTLIQWFENVVVAGVFLPLYGVGFPIMLGATISGENPRGDNVFNQLDVMLIIKDFLIGSVTLVAFFMFSYWLWHYVLFPTNEQ